MNQPASTNKKTQGFTLIELLVVISIIGLLSSIVLASLNGARTKANNVARFQEVRQLVNALNLYKLDHGNYPTQNVASAWLWIGQCQGNCYAWGAVNINVTNDSVFTTAMAPYFSAVNLPVDSKTITINGTKFNTGIFYTRWKDNTSGIYDGSKYVSEILWTVDGGTDQCHNPPSAEADNVPYYWFPASSTTLCELDLVD